MKIKGFRIGKSKEKPKDNDSAAGNNTTEQIADMEEKINDRTKNLEETAQELQGLSDESPTSEESEAIPAGPHGPLDELTVDPDVKSSDGDDFDIEADTLAEGGEEIKVVELGAGGAAPPEGEKEAKVEDTGGDSINNLFGDDEEEENPLVNLIKALPDVPASELIDDLNEIKGIIKEWQQS
jgi:hypothetical protein